MPPSMYSISVPVYAHILSQLAATLDKAAAHCEAMKIEPKALIGARLFPNMWSLAEQVRAVCNHATRGPARIGGLPIPQFEGKDRASPTSRRASPGRSPSSTGSVPTGLPMPPSAPSRSPRGALRCP